MTLTVRESQELDFERLTEISMEWNEKTWFEQAKEGRFEGRITFHHRYIYWFENYASLILARDILIDFKEDYCEMFDTATEEWVMTSSYATEGWR